MVVCESESQVRQMLKDTLLPEESLGFVATMGALHEGHLQLLDSSMEQNDKTMASIFVNPLQFNESEDFKNYPTRTDEDLKLLEQRGCDFVFVPKAEDLYPKTPTVSIDLGPMAKILEGKFRPGHFDGVGIVVSKLFNIISPTRAYFGLKDLQQYLLIKQMTLDLSFEVEVIGVPTARAASGLALSSRNERLSPEGKGIAANIFKGLIVFQEAFNIGHDPWRARERMVSAYQQIPELEIEYVELLNIDGLELLEPKQSFKDLAVCVAGYVEGIRLIDNLYLRHESS